MNRIRIIIYYLMLSSLLKCNGFLVGKVSLVRYSRPTMLTRQSSSVSHASSSYQASYDNEEKNDVSDNEEETRLLLNNEKTIKVKIKSIGHLGAHVEILYKDKEENLNDETIQYLPKKRIEGLINMDELKLYRDHLKQLQQVESTKKEEELSNVGNGEEDNEVSKTETLSKNLYIGDEIKAYIHNIRNDGKVAVGLRPNTRKRTFQTRDLILNKLNEKAGILHLGDKSDPKFINKMFPGISKKQFKLAVGSLFKEGLVTPSPNSIVLVKSSTTEKKSTTKNNKNNSNFVTRDTQQIKNQKVKSKESDDNNNEEENVKPKLTHNYLTDGDRNDDDDIFMRGGDNHFKNVKLLKKGVPKGVGIDSVYITGLSFKTKEKALIRWIEESIPYTRVVEVKDFYNDDGRPSGKAIVRLEIDPYNIHQEQQDARSVNTKSNNNHHLESNDFKNDIIMDKEEVDGGDDSTLLTDKKKKIGKIIPLRLSYEVLLNENVDILKQMLKSYDLKVSGLKSELIERLLKYDAIKHEVEEEEVEEEEEEEEEEKEILIEDLVSNVCELNDKELHHRNVKIRPYFPARNNRNPSHMSESSSTSSWMSEEFENELKSVSRNKYQTSSSSSELKEGKQSEYGKKEEEIIHDEKKKMKNNIKKNEKVNKINDERMLTNSNDYRLARLSGNMKRGGKDNGKKSGNDKFRKDRQHKQNFCVFFGNLPYSLDQLALAEEIEAVVGEDTILEMRLSPFGDYCHVDFKNEDHAAIAVREMNKFIVNKRPLRVDYADKDKQINNFEK